MPTQPAIKANTGEFMARKCVFLLASSVGNDMAAKIVQEGLASLGLQAADLTVNNMPHLSGVIERALRSFVGDDKARRLASALRVLVGGVKIEIGREL